MRIASFAIVSTLFTSLTLAQPAPESVYAPPEVPSGEDGTNLGAVHMELSLSYFTDYVYRGVEVFEVDGPEDKLNLQLDGKVSFDLGKLPHPFVSVFVNVAEDDPISDFQEIRPTVGFDWTIKPIVISAGYVGYIYPDRDDLSTSEVFLKVALDENVLFGGQTVPAPYAMAAYDFDLYDGLYLEAGIEYKLKFEEIGLTLNFMGNVAYVSGWKSQIQTDDGVLPGFFTTALTSESTIDGLQHWQVGVVGEYSLNQLFNVSSRYGDWSIRGYLFYTDSVDEEINATSQIWGGAGITFRY